MRTIVLALLLAACSSEVSPNDDTGALSPGDTFAHDTTDIFHACQEGSVCETGYCANLNYDFEAGPTVCTEVCETQQDCQDIHPNALCICDFTPEHICWTSTTETHQETPAHCLLRCWPEENPELCKKYNIFCPSDCAKQGLICGLVTLFPSNYACRPEIVDPGN